MKDAFQSKDIQKMLHIPKQRVEYLSLKVPIRPDVAEVEGTGRAHLYSFKNALEFAIAQEASNLGFYITEVRSLLNNLDSWARSELSNDFDLFAQLKSSYEFIYPLLETDRHKAVEAMRGYFSTASTVNLYALLSKQRLDKIGEEVDTSAYSHAWLPVTDGQILMPFVQGTYGTIILNLAAIKQRVILYATEGK